MREDACKGLGTVDVGYLPGGLGTNTGKRSVAVRESLKKRFNLLRGQICERVREGIRAGAFGICGLET